MGHVVGPDDRALEAGRLARRLNTVFEIAEFFDLDPYQQFWFSTTAATIDAVQHHVEGIVSNMDDYLRLRPQFFPDHHAAIESMRPWAGPRTAARRSSGSRWKAASGSPAR